MTRAALDLEDKTLVFLVGAPRSGTTWLQLLLSSSPSIATANETHLFSAYTPSLFAAWTTFSGNPREIGLGPLMSEDEYLGFVRDLSSQVMIRILQRNPEASIILEKTPGHALHWRSILRVFPEARFLHIIRDPRAVVASLQAARKWGGAWPSPQLTENCNLWRSSVTQARAISAATPHYLEVRYEALVENGPSLLQGLFLWMGLDESLDTCAHIIDANRIERLRTDTTTARAWDLTREPAGFFRNGRVDGWRRELTAVQIQIVQRLTGDLAFELGYPHVDPGLLGTDKVVAFCSTSAAAIRDGLRWRARRWLDAWLQ